MGRQRQKKRTSAAEAFRVYLERLAGGDDLDFEVFRASWPELGHELQTLHDDWRRAISVFDPRDERPTLNHRFEQVFGKQLEPRIVLEAEPASKQVRAPDHLLRRLAAHSPARTRYRLKGEIAHGGMGSVFKVWDEDLRRNLAMKVILGQPRQCGPHGKDGTDVSTDSDKKALERFLAEAQVTAQLDHPGIVPVHELGVDDHGGVYFTMRLVKGRELRDVFRMVAAGEEGWNQTRVLGVLLRVCEAMAYAHSKRVIHRDLKPENIMVGRFGQTYVMDWGLARVLGQEDRRDLRIRCIRHVRQIQHIRHIDPKPPAAQDPLVTMDGEIVGTPSYMSPEQAQGTLEVGPQSDIYSMGAMLYHLLSGRVPYESSNERLSPHAILHRLTRGPPVPLSAAVERVPGELAAICDKAMAYEIPERYASMEELADDLRAYLEGRVVQAYETGQLAALRKWTARNRSLAALAALLLILTTAFVFGMLKKTKVAFANERRAARSESIAREETLRANQNAARLDGMRRQAEQERDRVLRLSDVKRLADLREELDRLWPARPDLVPDMKDWLSRAAELVRRSESHRMTLVELRGWAVPQESEGRTQYAFDDAETAWWHDTLAQLVADLDVFTSDDPHGRTIASLRARLELAESLERRTLEEPRADWQAAIAAIADPARCPRYEGLEIEPQLGLVPLRLNPDSGLYEFWHLPTGDRPELDDRGRPRPSAKSGLVLVLIPGGEFWMGAQSDDPLGRNYDPAAEPEESPPHRVRLDPFLLSKYELTQGQWQRLTGTNPSAYHEGLRFAAVPVTPTHPVEQVSWDECHQLLSRLELTLPTEAQWEYACRAGTASFWWPGDALASLSGAANLADAFCRDNGGPQGWSYEESLDDSFVVHAPVGSFQENPFGLQDTIGNVWEWCLDGLGAYSIPVREGDGLRLVDGARNLAFRGGAFSITADHARSSARSGYARDYRFNSLGLRPARPLVR